MCKLTLIDIDPATKLSKASIRGLTELNSVATDKNEDGFGYMTFAKAPEITKTAFPAEFWWERNQKEFQKSVRNANGIYHVRSASLRTGTLYQKDAHPFRVGHIIVAHNGTLREQEKLENNKEIQKLFPSQKLKNTKDIEEDVPMIDSEKYCQVLAHVCGDKLVTPEKIKKAMSYFAGVFALLIYDTKQPKTVFIARGTTKKLYEAVIYKEGRKEPIGLVLNTGEWELTYWARNLKMFAREYLGEKVEISIREVPEDAIYEYKIGSYRLPECSLIITQNNLIISRPAVQDNRVLPGVQNHNHKNTTYWNNKDDDTFKILANLAGKLGLGLQETMLLSEVCLGQCLHIVDEDNIGVLIDVLEELQRSDYTGRHKVWREWLTEKKLLPLTGYKASGIEFPFMLNSKKSIKNKTKKAVLKKGEI